MTTEEALKAIVPGKTYPAEVIITETVEGKEMVVKFCLQSYFVGMYRAVYLDGRLALQDGDHNNKSCVAGLKNDIQKALKRGAKVEIGTIRPVKTSC